jgi:DNA-binding beta-propeller fold protein YncE
MIKSIALACSLGAIVALAQPAAHVPPYPRVDVAIGYKADPGWPKQKAPGGEWGAMSSVAIGPDRNIWTLNRGKIPVQVFTPEGALVKYWGQDGLFSNPHTIRFDKAGNLWIVDTGTQTVRKFTLDGKVLMTIGTPHVAGADQTHMNQPNDVAFASNGDIYVSDGYGNDRIVVFNKHGKYVRSWGKLGQGPGEFSQPHSIVLDSKNRVYVADRNNVRIQVFDSRGNYLTEWQNIITPWALAITADDQIYVCGSSPMLWSEIPANQAALATPPKDQLFMKLDTEGRLRGLWLLPKGDNDKEKPGEVNWIHSVAVDWNSNVYLAEVQGKRVQKFVPTSRPAEI